MAKIKAFFTKEDGQGMVEYGLIIALVAVVAIVGLTLVGKNLSNDEETGIFDQISDKLTAEEPAGGD